MPPVAPLQLDTEENLLAIIKTIRQIASKISLDMMNCGAILALPFLLREDPAFLFDDREITNVPPRIWADVLDMNKNVIYEKLFQKDARFKIYIEKVSIAKCKIL